MFNALQQSLRHRRFCTVDVVTDLNAGNSLENRHVITFFKFGKTVLDYRNNNPQMLVPINMEFSVNPKFYGSYYGFSRRIAIYEDVTISVLIVAIELLITMKEIKFIF